MCSSEIFSIIKVTITYDIFDSEPNQCVVPSGGQIKSCSAAMLYMFNEAQRSMDVIENESWMILRRCNYELCKVVTCKNRQGRIAQRCFIIKNVCFSLLLFPT